MKIKTVAETPRLWQCSAMLKLRSQFIVYSLQFITVCAAMANGVDVSTRQPIDFFDSATMVGDVLKNLQHDDSRYLIPLPSKISGNILTLVAEVVLSQSNSVVIALGDVTDPEALTLRCTRGVWAIFIGNQLRGFTDPLPAPIVGTHTYKIRLVTDTSKNRFTSTLTTFQDGVQVANTISVPSPSAWLNSGTHPANWTQATLSLRGRDSGLKFLRCDMTPPPTLIIIR